MFLCILKVGYDSFGKQVSSSGSLTNPFQYAARDFDAETNLYYYRNPYYPTTTQSPFCSVRSSSRPVRIEET